MPMNLDKYQKCVLILGYIMGKLGKVFVLTLLISSLGMINLPSANADGVVDQSNIPGTVAKVVPISTAPPVIAQTFTPTTPDIVAIDIFLQGGDAGVLLDIFIVDNAFGSVIGEPNFNPGCPCSGLIAIHLDFTGVQTNPLTTGSTNTISIQHSSTSSDAVTTWAGSAANAYTPGSAQGPGTSPATDDYFFRTYEGPSVAVGSISIPIDTTSLLLADTQSFSWMIPVVLSVLGIGLFVASRKSK